MWIIDTYVPPTHYSSSPDWVRSPQQFDTAAGAAQELSLVLSTMAEHGYTAWGRIVRCPDEVAS